MRDRWLQCLKQHINLWMNVDICILIYRHLTRNLKHINTSKVPTMNVSNNPQLQIYLHMYICTYEKSIVVIKYISKHESSIHQSLLFMSCVNYASTMRHRYLFWKRRHSSYFMYKRYYTEFFFICLYWYVHQ